MDQSRISKQNNVIFVYSALVFAQILFGLNFIAAKHVLGFLRPYEFSCARFLLSGLILFFSLRIFKVPQPRLTAKQIAFIVLAGIFGISLSQTLFLTGLKMTTAINTSIIASLIPLFALAAAVMRKQVQGHLKLYAGAGIALLGVIVLKGAGLSVSESTLTGDFLVMLGSFLSGIYISFSKDIFSYIRPIEGTSLLFIFGGLALIPVTWLVEGSESYLFSLQNLADSNFDQTILYAFLYSAIGATLIAYFISNWAVTRVDPSKVGSFIFIQPLVAAIAAVIFLQEQFYWHHFLGMMMILWGLQWALSKKKQKE